MAIPIAEGSINKQFQAPRAAQGKAVDLSQNIQQIGQQTINAIQGIQDFQTAQEEQTANDAITLYSQQMMDLNTKLKRLKGKDAVDFAPKYKEEAKKYHAQFLSNIGGTSNKVARSATDKINNFNMNNQEQFALYTEGARIESEGQSLDASHDALTSLHLEGYTGDALADAAMFYTFTKQCDEYALKKAALIGMANDSTYVLQKQKEARTAFMKQAVDKIIRENGNRKALAFLDLIQGYVPEEDRWEIGRDRSLSQLKIEVTKYPERFVKNGKVNEEYLSDKYFPFLKPEDRLFAYAEAKKNAGNSDHSEQDLQFFISTANSLKNKYEEELWNLGFATKRMEVVRRRDFPATMSNEEITKSINSELKKNFEKEGTLAKYIELRAKYQADKTRKYINPSTGAIENNIFRHADNLTNDGRSLEEIFDGVGRNLIVYQKGQSALDAGWFSPRDLTVKEVATQYVYDVFAKDAGGDPSQINWRAVVSVLTEAEKKFNTRKKDAKGEEILGSSFIEQVGLDEKAKDAFISEGKENAKKKIFDQLLAESLREKGILVNTSINNIENVSGSHFIMPSKAKQAGAKVVDVFVGPTVSYGNIYAPAYNRNLGFPFVSKALQQLGEREQENKYGPQKI